MKTLTAQDIPQQIIDLSTELWVVFTGRGLETRAVFPNLDKATAFVCEHVAKGLHLQADLKHDWDDDHSTLSLGAVTALRWECPMRPMTREEVLACKSRYEKDWLKNPPNTDDFDRAARLGVRFIGSPVSCVNITRCSRYIGYIHRSGYLNDKTKQVSELIKYYNEMIAREAAH